MTSGATDWKQMACIVRYQLTFSFIHKQSNLGTFISDSIVSLCEFIYWTTQCSIVTRSRDRKYTNTIWVSRWMYPAGSAVSTYPAPGLELTVALPFTLQAAVTSPTMTATCRNSYTQAIVKNLIEVSRLVNLLICNQTLCPSLTGSPGTGIPLNRSQTLFNHVLYVAINTAAINPAGVQIDANSAVNITTLITFSTVLVWCK